MIGHPFFVNCVIAFFAFAKLRVKEEGTRNEERGIKSGVQMGSLVPFIPP